MPGPIKRSRPLCYPFLRILPSVVAGLLTAHYFPWSYWGSYLLFCFFASLYGAGLLFSCSMTLRSLLAQVVLFMVGYNACVSHQPYYQPDHLYHVASGVKRYVGIVVEEVSGGRWCQQTTLQVTEVYRGGAWQSARGKVRLSAPDLSACRCGDRLLVVGAPLFLQGGSAPYSAASQRALENRGIYHCQSLPKRAFCIVKRASGVSLTSWPRLARAWARKQIERYFLDPDAQAILLAVLLGIRADLTTELRGLYSQTGVAHLLAISGLHMGLLYMLLVFFLYLIGLLLGRPLRAGLLPLGFLWGYALLVGPSASVIRSLGMVTLAAASRWARRSYALPNALAAVAFLLLLWDPYALFDIGFQLSFTAVAGILLFYPPIYALLRADGWFDRWWQMTALSLAAQIGTLPLTLYYFHFFPTYFLLANWVAVPFAPFVLAGGIAFLLTTPLPGLSSVIALFLQKAFALFHGYLLLLTTLPYPQFGPYSFSKEAVLLLYLVFLAFYLTFRYRRFSFLSLGLLALSFFSASRCYQSQRARTQEKLLFYGVAEYPVVGYLQGQHMRLFTPTPLSNYSFPYRNHIVPSLIALHVAQLDQVPLEALGLPAGSLWKGKRVVCLYKASLKCSLRWPVDYLLVDGVPVEALCSWLPQQSVGMLLLSGSYTDQERARLACAAQQCGISVHDLYTEGALIV